MTTTMRPSTGFFLFCCLGARAVQGSLVSLGNCQSDTPTGTLILGFRDSCDHDCAVSAMARSGVPADAYDHLASSNMIVLRQYSPANLASLRGDESTDYIECDGAVGINAGNPEEGGMMGGESSSTGAEVAETPLIKLSNCDTDVPTSTLIIGFQRSCDNGCAVSVMARAGVPADAYDHYTNLNMITLRQHSPANLASLRSDENIEFIECDGVAGIAVGNPDKGGIEVSNSIGAGVTEAPLINLSNCDTDVPTGTLIIGFQDSCDNRCAVSVMARTGVPADAYNNLTNLNMITLYQYSPENLASLRSDENIDFIECDGVVSIAVGNPDEGGAGVSNSIGTGVTEAPLIKLSNCDSDAPTGILIIGFQESCGYQCILNVMAQSGVPADDAYNHLTNLNMITLGQYSPDNLASLRSDEHVDFIECDGVIGIADGNAEEGGMSVSNSTGGEVTETPLIKLSNCDSDVPSGTLIIGFEDSCDNDCAVNVMVRLGVAEDAYEHLTSSNMIVLRQYSPEDLASLSSDENIDFIECDDVAGIAGENPKAGGMGVDPFSVLDDDSGSSCSRTWTPLVFAVLVLFLG